MLLKYIQKRWETDKGAVAFLTGFLFTAIAISLSKILFHNTPHLIGITTIFFTVILTMPILTYILRKEELLEKRKGPFFRKNKAVIDFYIYFFLGVFALFTIAALVNTDFVFSKENFYNIKEPSAPLKTNLPPPVGITNTCDLINFNKFGISINAIKIDCLLKKIIFNNMYIVIVAFLISLLFGAGSIFLIILNASMAAAAIIKYIHYSGGTVACNLSIFSIHFIPEMIGYLIAALAGGLLAVDFAREKLFSKDFDEVFLDSGKLMGLATIFIVLAGYLEVYISAKLFSGGFCLAHPYIPPIILALGICGIVILERMRKKVK